MPKTKVICLILAVVIASAGTVSLAMNMSDDGIAPILPNDSVDYVLDKPTEGTPTDRSAIDNLYIAQGELQRKGGFVGTTEGTAVSAGLSQNVYNNRVVIGGNVFKEMITIGIVKNAYQTYISNGNYLYRNFDSIKSATNIKWSNTASRYSEKSFLEKFGHFSNALTGYILNDDTIVSGVLENEENGLYTYRYVLNTETAPARMLYEMKTNSNMSGYSTFTKAEIVVTMDADWQVKTLRTDCKYKVPMFGGINCVEDVTETFSDLTDEELPETEFFQQYFDADIIEKPVDTDPDALSVLMDIFAPYVGDNSLNVSLNATMNGQTVLNGLVSAKIDIENIANIEVSAKLGDDLYVQYQQGSVFVTYQDFKASTTVDGITGLVNALMSGETTDEVVNGNEDESDDGILSKFTYGVENNLCTVNLPLDIGDEQLNVNIYADVVEGKYQFRNAEVTFASFKLDIEPINEFKMPVREGEYPEILGLLDLVKDGVIYGNVNAFGMDVDVMFDLATMSLYATSGNLAVTYKDNTVYATLGAIKAKLDVNDIDKIMSLLRIAGVVDGKTSLELPQISLENVLATLGDIKATATNNGVAFSLSMDELSVAIYLVASENGWNIDKLTVEFGGNVITLAMTAPASSEIPEVSADEYADVAEVIGTFIDPVVSLAMAKGYAADFGSTVTIDNVAYNVNGSFTYDSNKNINVVATVSNGAAVLVKANVTVANEVVYLDVNGLKTAFSIADMGADIDSSEIIGAICGANDKLNGIVDAVFGIVNNIVNLDVSSIDFANVVKQFSFADGVLAVTANLDFVGLADIDIRLAVNNKGNLVATVDGLQIDCLTLGAQATVISNPRKVAVPNADDYILNLVGSVSDLEFAITADLLHMDIAASVQALGQTVLARYIDGYVYVKAGEIAVKGSINELGSLVDYVMTAIGADAQAVDVDSLAGIDLSLESFINAISINLDGALSLGLKLDGIVNVSVNFDSEANFAGITADVMGYEFEVTSSNQRAEKLDVDKAYMPVELLVKQVIDIYNNFKNVASTGIAVSVNTNVTIDGADYSVIATVNYNNGLYVNANIVDNAGKLAALDMYLVSNALYLDVNGVRIATELPKSDSNANVNVDLATILGALAQAKGYNKVLDSVIEVVEQLPENVNGIDYLALLDSLTYSNGVLSATINGELLGLSSFDVTLVGTNDIVLTLNNLAIGLVTINSLTASAQPQCNEVTAPTSDYVTELELEVMGLTITAKLDLYNKTVVAKTTLLNRDLSVYYADGAIYLKYSGVQAMLNLADIDRIIAVVNMFADVAMPQLDGDIDVKAIVNSLALTRNSNGYTAAVAINGIYVEVAFDNEARLTTAQVNVLDIAVKATLIAGASYPVFDMSAHYDNLADIAETYATAIKELLEAEGYGITLNGQFGINNNVYDVTATVNYNNGLYVNANIVDNAGKLAALDMYLVSNALYLDVNGVRIATELPKSDSNANVNVDLATILGALAKAKGYNKVLDSVIEVVEQLPDRLDGINWADLLGAIGYANGELFLVINGQELGLSQTTLQLAANNGVNATISNLVAGDVVASLELNVTSSASEVVAPTSDYVTELELEVMGLTITAKLDLYNKTVVAKTTLLDHELGLYFVDNTVYVSYGAVNAKLNIADVDTLIAVISSFVDGGVPSMDMPELNVKQILNSVSKVATDNGYELSVTIAGVNVTLSFDAQAKLVSASVNVNDLKVTATLISGATYPLFDLGADYVDVVALAQTFADGINNVRNADGYDITLNGNFAFDNNVYGVAANVIYSDALYVNANVSYNTVSIADVELWLVNNTLYVSMGELKLAIAMPKSNSNTNGGSDKIDLTPYKGYNPYVDGVLDVVQALLDKFVAGNVDYVALIDRMTFVDGVVTLNVNGEQLGLNSFNVQVAADNCIALQVRNLTVDKLTASFDASVKAYDGVIEDPKGDFTTNLSIKIDDKNTVYANLDLINGVYNFRLDDLYAMYADNIIYVNKGDMYVSGNINDILDYVKQIDDLVNEFSGATESTMAKINLDSFKNIDVKAIVNSLAIQAVGGAATVSAQAFGFDIQVYLVNGEVNKATVPVSLIKKTLEIAPCAAQTFDKFNGEQNYIQIERVFNDYFPAFERLVHTNSWVFNFDGDVILSMDKSVYKIAAGSYLEFYYKNTEGMDTFKLRAKLDVHKYNSTTDYWQPYMDLDIVYKDGNIYITDRGRLISGKDDADRSAIKLTVSIKTLVKCYALYDDIVAVVPQIGELVDGMFKAMEEAEANAENISYSTILSDISYVEGLFGLTLNGQPLLSKLGAIALSAQTFGKGLSLNHLQLEYDTISLQLNNLRVYASEVVEIDGATEYVAVNDINAYNTSGHMDFNSLYELLSAFVVTATPIDNSNTRSFYVDGTATVALKIIGLNVADIDMGLAVKVDINEDNKVFISAKITRTKPSGFGTAFVDVYNDNGGDSYLYYDGVNETFTVIRNSIIDYKYTVQEQQYKWHCTKCDADKPTKWCAKTTWDGWTPDTHNDKYMVQVPDGFKDVEKTEKNYYYERHYAAENITTEQFTANIMDYILELFNFGSTIKDPIVKAIQEPNNNDFGFEDILKDYSYSEEQKVFALNADLTAIDSNLGPVDVTIYHDVDFNLTNLNVNVELLKGMCKAKVPFELKTSTYGDATNIVKQVVFW